MFGTVILAKKADINKYGYYGYRIKFDRRSGFFFPGGGFGQNVITCEVDMSSSVILVKGPTQWLKHTLTAKKCIQLTLRWLNKKFCLSLLYNGANG